MIMRIAGNAITAGHELRPTSGTPQERLALLDDWLAEQRRIWEERTDRLEHFVTGPTEGRR
jgi:hypothetical protein